MGKPINITEASSIAIHSLALMAGNTESLNVVQVSEKLGISKNHLAMVLNTLTKHGYLKSERGPKGGFKLNQDIEKKTLLDIYQLFEGELSEDHCGIEHDKCPFAECVFGNIRQKLTAEFREYFQNRRIVDLVRNTNGEL